MMTMTGLMGFLTQVCATLVGFLLAALFIEVWDRLSAKYYTLKRWF